MNPKQKAAYLIVKYMSKVVSKQVAIECSLVSVEELMNEYHGPNPDGSHEMERYLYFKEVKEEIEKL